MESLVARVETIISPRPPASGPVLDDANRRADASHHKRGLQMLDRNRVRMIEQRIDGSETHHVWLSPRGRRSEHARVPLRQ